MPCRAPVPGEESLCSILYAGDLWTPLVYLRSTPEPFGRMNGSAGTLAIHGVNFIEQSASLTNKASKRLSLTRT